MAFPETSPSSTSKPEMDTVPARSAVENASLYGASVLTGATALNAIDTYNHASIPLVSEIPGIEHSSSMSGSFAVGAVTTAASESLAHRFESRGKDKAAEKIRLAGKVGSWVGSLACQLAIEMSTRGVTDKWDIIAGLTATAPGMIAGRVLTAKPSTAASPSLESKYHSE